MPNAWDNDPIIKKADSAHPWDNDPIISAKPAVASVAALPQLAPKSFMGRFGDALKASAADEWNTKTAGMRDLTVGAVDKFGKLGSNLLYPLDQLTDVVQGNNRPTLSGMVTGKKTVSTNDQRRANIGDVIGDTGADQTSIPFKGGGLAVDLAASGGVGGILKKGLLVAAPRLAATATGGKVLNAIASGGFKTGAPAAATLGGKAADLAIRSTGGAINGAASTALIDPSHAGAGAAIGAILPPGIGAIGGLTGYTGKALKSLVQPLTDSGQQAIAGSVLRRFAEGGPTALNLKELVPGSLPTLAEASGNAGLAGLQRGARSMPENINAFVGHEQANAAARTAALDNVAGDATKLEFFQGERRAMGKQLYDDALAIVPPPPTPYLKGQITQLLKRPSIDTASRKAQQWAIERGEKPFMNGSMQGLHDTKTALDDMINEAVIKGQGGHAEALKATQAKLLDVMEKFSPAYKEARVTYAAMSKPVNSMEAMQGMRLTDAKGDMTLSKIKTGIEGLERARGAAGFNNAKSIDTSEMAQLQALHDDLLRQNNLSLGKAAGSDTFQNFATNNILESVLPGGFGAKFVRGKFGTLAAQGGKLAYSGADSAIRSKLTTMMLDPAAAQAALIAPGAIGNRTALTRLLQSQKAQKAALALHRSAPLLSSDR